MNRVRSVAASAALSVLCLSLGASGMLTADDVASIIASSIVIFVGGLMLLFAVIDINGD